MLTLAYLLPVLLLGLLLLRADLVHWQKGLLLAALPVFYIVHYLAIANLGGWPSTQTLP